MRVYRNRTDAVSPLSKSIHDLLFKAACGEIRFVFDTANTLVQKIVAKVRLGVSGKLGNSVAAPSVIEQVLTDALKEVLIDNQIPDEFSMRFLRRMTDDATSDLRKSPQNVARLKLIGERAITKEDYEMNASVSDLLMSS
ncbi:MAG: hypothetical protein ACT4QB_02460 [Gammaproteobacteria bacterium]